MGEPQDESRGTGRRRGRAAVLAWRALGVAAVALATVGAFLPVMPTTVFLIVALWAFAHGSPDLADKLRAHPRFGPVLVRWEEKRAIPTKAKAMAVTMMAASWALLLFASHNLLVVTGVGALLLAVAGYVVTRPSG